MSPLICARRISGYMEGEYYGGVRVRRSGV